MVSMYRALFMFFCLLQDGCYVVTLVMRLCQCTSC